MSNIVERKKVTEKKYIFISCFFCGERIKQYRPKHKYCSSGCRFKDWSRCHPRIKIDLTG